MKSLNIQDFFEVSVKDNFGIDEVFFKSVINCADIQESKEIMKLNQSISSKSYSCRSQSQSRFNFDVKK
jgi:hypothetical protein